MTRKHVISLTFSLIISMGYGQNQKPDCRKYLSGCFLETRNNDSLILFRGLQYWIEADIKHRYCEIYKIEWKNRCSFTLLFSNRFYEEIHNATGNYVPPDLTNYDLLGLSADSISATYNRKKTTQNWDASASTITLKPIKDTDSWKYLIDADTSLYSDTTEIKKLYGFPFQNYYYNVPDFIKSLTDTAGLYFADYALCLLETGDVRPLYQYSGPLLKRSSSDSVFNDLNEYIQHAFGNLLNYEVISIDEDNSRRMNPTPIYNMLLDAQFSKVKQKLKLALSVASGTSFPLMSLNIAADSANEVTFIDSLTTDFWRLLKKKDFKAIYNGSTIALQDRVPYEYAEKTLSGIYSLGHLDEYKLFFETFSVIEKKGYVNAGYKCKINDKSYLINIIYTLENGKYKIASLNPSGNN